MKEDKRVRYTKMFLKESLLKFLSEKPLTRITVKELCENAEINRTTYYAHYRDPVDQFQQIEMEFIGGLDQYLSSLLTEVHLENIQSILLKVFTYIYENRELCYVFFGEHGDVGFENKLSNSLKKYVFAVWQMDIPEAGSSNDYKYTYVISGSIGFARKWLFEVQDSRSVEEIVDMLMEISTIPLK